MKNKWVFCALALVAVSVRAETIDELDLSADQTIEVAAGTTNRIEYLSGTAAATLTKTGLGTLEIAVFGNTNATIRVAEGALKAVRPARIALNGNVYFHLDATDAQARTVSESGGTNFITQLADSAGGALVANRVGSLPCPYVGDRTLNGLPVYDFGVYSKVSSTQGAAMQVSAPAIINELFYVWEDREGTKDAVAADTLGPNAVNMRYSYRGLGGSGQDFKLFYTAHGQITDTITIDGVKTASSTPVTEGWHLAAWWANKPITSPVEDYGFYGFGFCPNGLAGYGGVRIAEVIACSTTNTVAQRLRVNRYLQQKWFGGLPVKFLSLRSGATLDTSDAPLSVVMLDAQAGSSLQGEQLTFATVLAGMPVGNVSSPFAIPARSVSLTPDLAFSGDAVVSVAAGTGLVDKVSSSTGVLQKNGEGALTLAFPDAGVTAIKVDSGALVIDPLATPSAYVHVDATRADTMTLLDDNGTNLVTQWRDVNGNGRFFTRSAEKHAYGTKGLKNYPYVTADLTNGLSVVDFGTFNDFMHQDGWGAEMNLTPAMAGPHSVDNPPVWNILAVWGDREEAKNIPLVNGNEFRGPCLFGAGGAWYRGYGGGGTAFRIRDRGSSNMGEDNWVDGTKIGYVEWMNTYQPPERLFVQNTFIPGSATGIQQIGGNATETTPGYERGVAGGLRLGELLVFRQELPTDERFRMDRALGAKWFGRANPYAYERITVAEPAELVHACADVTVSNLTVAGKLSVRNVRVKNLTVTSGQIDAPLTLLDGGTLVIAEDEASGYPCLTASSVSFAGSGTLDVSADCFADDLAVPIKVMSVSGGPDVPAKVPGWHTASGPRAILVRHSDGYYLEQPPGLLLIVR